MTASAGERRSAATLAAAGSAWLCPEVAGAASLGGGGRQPPEGDWVTMGHRAPAESQDKAGSLCLEECEADSQCPQGQRCTSTGCGRVCMDIPGGESQPGSPGAMQGHPKVPHGGVP